MSRKVYYFGGTLGRLHNLNPAHNTGRREAAQGMPRERSLSQREGFMAQLSVGDVVIRSHRLLKTVGTIVGAAPQRPGEPRRVWVKWNHSDTLPNPSREAADTLELVRQPDELPTAARVVRGEEGPGARLARPEEPG
jgi:hypothetical protein